MLAAVGRTRWGRQQGLHQRPQLIRHEVINEGRHARIMHRPAQWSETPSKGVGLRSAADLGARGQHGQPELLAAMN
jgi:hypothetical protein